MPKNNRISNSQRQEILNAPTQAPSTPQTRSVNKGLTSPPITSVKRNTVIGFSAKKKVNSRKTVQEQSSSDTEEDIPAAKRTPRKRAAKKARKQNYLSSQESGMQL